MLGSTCENQIFFKEKDPQLITKDLAILFFHKGLESANSPTLGTYYSPRMR